MRSGRRDPRSDPQPRSRIARRGVLGRTAALILVLLVAQCAGNVPPPGAGIESDFLKGKALFDQGRYLDAIKTLETFRNEHPGSDRVDDAIFMLGEAHQRIGEDLLARDEYDRLLRDFPQSEHREEAEFLRGTAWLEEAHGPALDPEPIRSALEAFQNYQRHYTEGKHFEEASRYIRICQDRLAVKEWMNGKTYLSLGQPTAAALYFEKALHILPDFSRAGDALAGLAKARGRLGQVEPEREAWRKLLDYATPDRMKTDRRLRSLRAEAEKALADSTDG